MVTDGLTGSDKSLKFLGVIYDIIMASGDIFALIVAVSIIIFLARRIFLHIRRFEGIEMKKVSHMDANLALSLILFLMISLLGLNATYVQYRTAGAESIHGVYPVGSLLAGMFNGMSVNSLFVLMEIFWWSHILLIFLFANILPYSKHFHVFMSVPNVFLSRLEPLGKMTNMDSITREVKLMLDPNTAFSAAPADAPVERFGVKDAEDVSWKNYFDALSCTECGRCTSVCPANITGKKLSPRKIMMDLRARMKEKGPGLVREGYGYDDHKALIRNYITEEELWACTTCSACAMECPININQPCLILDMRRYLVMEEGSAPGGLKTAFSNIENNGAPWQYSPEDRMVWAENLEMKAGNN
jgi:ferredoxin